MLDSSAAPKVVVLGRAGDAQQQLQQALVDIGVQSLATGDLDQLDPEQMRDAHPNVFLVSIDEATKDASLARWQTLFDAPGTTVVFDDADVTRHLSGWDLARWARHLVAKVLGKPGDVLPPVQADAERLPQTLALDETMPAFDRGAEVFGQDMDSAPVDSTEMTLDAGETDFAALSSQFEAQQLREASADKHSEVAPSLDEWLAHDANASSLPDIDVAISSAVTAPSEAVESAKPASASATPSTLTDLELTPFDTTYAAAKAVEPKEPAVDMDLSAYALEPLQYEAAQEMPAKKPAREPAMAPAAATPVAGVASSSAAGLVAIIAGLGGPDAVRQVLAGLPKTLPVPVLLWQHLDAGKHDRLAQQLGKASALPVYLASPGELARSGAVAVMAASVGVAHDTGGWRFNVSQSGVASALESTLGEPASMVLVLSGADGSVVDMVAAHAARGSEVRVQTPDSCFDGAAASALNMRGVTAASPVELAAAAASHWPA